MYDEIGCSRFLQQNPSYDGRGVVVAVFDTGVDPAAAGLQTTTDGKPKVIDIIDPTGSSDVDTSKVAKVDADGNLSLLSGRTMIVPECWKTTSETEFHIGIKRVYELCPEVLKKRLRREAKEDFEMKHNPILTQAVQDMHEWDSKHPNKTPLNAEERKTKANFADAKETLEGIAKEYQDCGPVVDCILFAAPSDSEGKWLCCVVQPTCMSLEDAKLMLEYRYRQEYGRLSEASMVNYSFNVYCEGDVLSVVTTSGAHGTHVASILAAHHPDNPKTNGIAPGAQIISIKIGDTRLNGMETGTGVARGWVETILKKADLVNMSYGEDAAVCNHGYITELANHAVRENDIVFVTSAGNSGPALSSVTAPGGTTSECISVGACVSQPMVDAEYCMAGSIDAPTQYTWSSRGPATNGSAGVTLSAPGGAVASVPNFTLNCSQLMNGTSMASPNACGGVALLLSALKQKKALYTPQAIKSCLVATCEPIKGVESHAQGAGIMQVDRALKAFCGAPLSKMDQNAWAGYTSPSRQCGYDISCNYHGHPSRGGIYLRETYETSPATTTCAITVKPFFSKKICNTLKVDFELKLMLECEADWVAPPNHVVLNSTGRVFNIEVDMDKARAMNLPGTYATTVYAYDSDEASGLPLFSIPVTIMIPYASTESQHIVSQQSNRNSRIDADVQQSEKVDYTFNDIAYTPAHMERHVFSVPSGATWADVTVTVTSGTPGSSKVFILHAQQLHAQAGHSTSEYKTRLPVKEGIPLVRSFRVIGGSTLELCVAQFWNSLGDCLVSTHIEFHGIMPNLECVALHGDDEVVRVDAFCKLRPETLDPTVVLKDIRQHFRPKTTTLRPLPIEPRNTMPHKGPVYELLLQYEFNQEESESSQVTPRFPLLNGTLYESVFQQQLCVILDKKNRVHVWSDAFPSKCKLPKGEYIARLQVCSYDLAQLERLRNMLLVLETKLQKDIPLDVYPTFEKAVVKSSNHKFKKRSILKGQTVPVFITPPPADKLPKWAKAGDTLVGTVTYGKQCDTAGCGKRPRGWSLVVHVAPVIVKENPSKDSPKIDAEPLEAPLDDFSLSVLKYKVKLLPGEYKKDQDKATTIYKDLQERHPTHLPLYAAWLECLDAAPYKSIEAICLPTPEDCEWSNGITISSEIRQATINCATELISQIDQTALAAYNGIQQDPDAADKKKMATQKTLLIDALYRKARAYAAAHSDAENLAAQFTETYEQLCKWVGDKDKAATRRDTLELVDHVLHQRYGSAVKLAIKVLKYSVDGDVGRLLSDYIRDVLSLKLGWSHLQEQNAQAVFRNLPTSMPLM
ncbi:hypothetical protein SARC_02449 [Sphaeroforma arctica JP610]|uniref:tripeptidyl-peptidase II n=1 Tax=Sphaeroforma arctica JP610 TaxID=667725 RepID=A0A0L0G8J1_9EUKA|nr:hypothetical protein SARC_02449 [Sphaeroforma arctica JP610]KNC85357.1 hypothetical protein SARC_02449 [Sphaeroforma arctica JP610]|eukprot:XP_014159259.1 hypothetical protein SARC_02449 [Sphaeroforma arctica JP610]